MFGKKKKEEAPKENVTKEKKKWEPTQKQSCLGCIVFLLLIAAVVVLLDSNKSKTTEPEKTTAELVQYYSDRARGNAADSIEQMEHIRIKKGVLTNDKWQVSQYREKPITDTDGKTYKISVMVAGQFETEKGGVLCNFMMGIGYEDKDALNYGHGRVLEYLNEDTGDYRTAIKEEDSLIKKTEDAAKALQKK